MDFDVAVCDDDLVDEVSAEAHFCVHSHPLESTREGATDLVDGALELSEGQSLSGFVGHLVDALLNGLQPPLDGSPTTDKLFELDRLLLVGVEKTLALEIGVADLTLQSAQLFLAQMRRLVDLMLLPPCRKE